MELGDSHKGPATGVQENWYDSAVSVLQQTRAKMMLGGVSPVLRPRLFHLSSFLFSAIGFRVLKCRPETGKSCWGQRATHQENSWVSNGRLGSSFAPS